LQEFNYNNKYEKNKINTTKSALMEFSHSISVAKIDSRGFTAVSEY
jgi:hypothetical protein